MDQTFPIVLPTLFPTQGADALFAWAIAGVSLAFAAWVLFRFGRSPRRLPDETVQRLGESEEHFRLIFEHSGVGMSLLSREGHFLKVNPTLARMLGYSAEELVGRRLADFVYKPDLSVTVTPLTGDPTDTPSLYEREKRYVRKDGESIWARVLRVPVRDATGKARHYVGVLVEITQRRKAEEALQASEKQYRLLNQVARDGIHVTGADGLFHDVNPAFCDMLGYDREQLTKMRLEQVAVDPQVVREHRLRIVRHGGDRLETRLRGKGGRVVDVEMAGALLDLEGRRLFHGICRDITERRRHEEALAEARDRLREERDFSKQVLETADALILVADPSGHVVRFNAACTAVSGYAEDEVRGQVFWDLLVAPRDQGAVREGHRRLVLGTAGSASWQALVPVARATEGEALTYECLWRTRAGDERLIAWRNALVHDAHGQVRYVIATGIDVTEQRRLEEQLRQARKMETLGTLVGGIAHDFNNQLTAVLGQLSLAQEDLADGPRPPGLEQKLAQAETAAQRCADITRRLLTFSRGLVSERQPVAVGDLLAEAERALRRELPAGVRLEVRTEADAWPVSADRGQLAQVLHILTANARDAMPQGGALTLTAVNRVVDEDDCQSQVDARPGRFATLTVADTGCGMTAEIQARLFEPFFTTKTLGHGAGMGLAMAYGIVKAHKGWITVHSVPGEGSAFTLYLPAVETAAPVGGEEPAPPVTSGAECILVVDDEELIRCLCQAVLERAGFRVLLAGDGEEALEVYRRHAGEIDLVLLDYAMPRLTGLQVLERLQAMDPAVCVVFSSGYTMDSTDQQLLASGARAFVPKPFRNEDLLRTLRSVLDQRAALLSPTP